MISNTYVGLSLLGICAVVGAGVSVGSGVAMIASVSDTKGERSIDGCDVSRRRLNKSTHWLKSNPHQVQLLILSLKERLLIMASLQGI